MAEENEEQEQGAQIVESGKGSLMSKYDINLNKKIDELSSEFATAYETSFKTGTNHKINVYTLIFENNFPPRAKVIQSLKKNKDFKTTSRIIDDGKISFSATKTRKYATILQKPIGLPLSSVIEREGPFSEKFVTSVILEQLLAELYIFNESEIAHGSINPRNIYYNKDTHAIFLTECISRFRGYSQDPIFESLNQLLSHPAGKGEQIFIADYFSLGMTLLYLLTGVRPIEEKDKDIILAFRLKYGSCDAMIETALEKAGVKITPRTKDLLKGLLTDNTIERWDSKKVTAWTKKEPVFPPTSNLHKKATSGLLFNEVEYFSLKHLAHDIQKNWNTAKRTIKIHDVSRWVNLSVKNPDMASLLDSLSPSINSEIILQDDKLIRFITTIDPEGPIRHQNYSCTISGVGTLLAYGYIKNNRDIIQFVGTIFNSGLVDYWINKQVTPTNYTYSTMGWGGSKIIQYLQKSGLGFGIERCLYELNKSLPCQSTMLSDYCVTTTKESLLFLDGIAENNHDNEPIDRHIAGFLGNRINMLDDLKVKSLVNFPFFAKNISIVTTSILTVAQKESGVGPVHNLSNWIYNRLENFIENMHSKTIRKNMKRNLKNASKDGMISSIFKAISSPLEIRNDLYGFQEAKKNYKQLQHEIIKYKTKSNIERMSYFHGLKTSVILSYLICVITTIVVMMSI